MDDLTTQSVRFGRLKRLLHLILLGACLSADRMSDRPATAATLQELFEGGSITVGNARFTNWELDSLSSTAETPDLTKIMVIPQLNDLANPGLLFATNDQLLVAGANSIDLMFTYRVEGLSTEGAFANHALALTGVNFGSEGGVAFVLDDLRDDSGNDLEPTLVIEDKASNFTQRHDMTEFAPQPALSVTTNVFVAGLSVTDVINLATFTQRFSQMGADFAAGDFDEDGDVDGNDLARWKAGFGATGNAAHTQGDADRDRDVDGADLLIWQQQLGGEQAAVAAQAAPEPSALLLVGLGLVGLRIKYRRSTRPL